MELVTSDNHQGLVNAAQRHFQNTRRNLCGQQRCQTHLARNVLGKTPRHQKGELAAWLRRIFRSESKEEACRAFRDLAEEMDGKASGALDTLEDGLEDAIAVLSLPAKYRRRLRITNMLERLIEEVRRRERVIRIFPNTASARRLIGALLAEQHEEWLTGRRYFDMDEYFEWKQKHQSAPDEPANEPSELLQAA